ncbi:MAG: hypothetical protein PVF74_13750 [Anaerolineales bacterium]|jgi:hypothetical protein
MPIGLFKGGGARIDIQLDRPEGPYYPGDVVRATIDLHGEKDLTVRQFTAGLLFWEQYTSEDSDGDSSTRSVTDEFLDQDILMKEDQLYDGFYRSFQVAFHLPNDAAPPYQSTIIQSGWGLRAMLDVGKRSDINEYVTIPLLVSPRMSGAQAGKYGDASHPDKGEMHLQLPRLEWIEGESVKGVLSVAPRETLNVKEIRVQLTRQQRVHAKRVSIKHIDVASKEKLDGKSRLEPTQAYEFPFCLPINVDNCPTRGTENTTVAYRLEGVLSRRFRKDFTVKTEIAIFTGDRPED